MYLIFVYLSQRNFLNVKTYLGWPLRGPYITRNLVRNPRVISSIILTKLLLYSPFYFTIVTRPYNGGLGVLRAGSPFGVWSSELDSRSRESFERPRPKGAASPVTHQVSAIVHSKLSLTFHMTFYFKKKTLSFCISILCKIGLVTNHLKLFFVYLVSSSLLKLIPLTLQGTFYVLITVVTFFISKKRTCLCFILAFYLFNNPVAVCSKRVAFIFSFFIFLLIPRRLYFTDRFSLSHNFCCLGQNRSLLIFYLILKFITSQRINNIVLSLIVLSPIVLH